MTEIEIAQPATPTVPTLGSTGADLIRESAAVMVDARAIAEAVAHTQMIPKHFQGKPDELTAAILYGASLNLDPMQSARQIYVVHGQAGLYARAMSALVQGAGHKVWTVETSDKSVTVSGQRGGSQHVETSTWTYDRAHQAGYTSNAKYKTDPQAMLYAKALSEVCRKIAPDVLNGIYSVEELRMEHVVGEVVDRQPATAEDRMAQILNVTQEPEPKPLTKRTQGRLFALFAQKGVAEDEQLPGVNHINNTEHTSRSQITEDEALRVIDVLEKRPDADQGGAA